MTSDMYWIPTGTPGRLAVMARPRGGDWLEDEVHGWRSAGVDLVVSLLTPGEVDELDLAQEEAVCYAQGIAFIKFPIPDRSVPASQEAGRMLATELAKCLGDGKNFAIHCRQGIGRAPLVAICVLVVAGVDPETAIAKVSEARGRAVPETLEQERWIADFVKEPRVLAAR